MKKQVSFFLLLSLIGVSCKHEKPNFTYMPNMAYSPAVKAQEEGSMRQPVEGTIARGFLPYQEDADTASRLSNPLPRNELNFKRGQKVFNIYCIVCHGPAGEGDGSIVPKFPRPPSLLSDKIKGWKDGQIYHVMTAGQNLMPSYASQIPREDRWAVVHYIRALQRAKNPSESDLERAKKALQE